MPGVARERRPRTGVATSRLTEGERRRTHHRLRQRPASLDERRTAIARIAREELVCSLPGDRDGHVLGGELAEHLESERREVSQGLVQRPDQILELVVVSDIESSSSWWSAPTALATSPCIGELRRSPSSTKPTENVFTGSLMFRAIRRRGARVEATPEHRPERDIAHQPKLNRFLEQLEQLARPWSPRGLGSRRGCGNCQ